MDSGASGYHLKSDSLERLAASICNRDAADAVAARLRRPMRAHRQLQPACAESEVAPKPAQRDRRSKWKSGSLLRWFKPIAKR
jgi:hypothetical protein